MSYLDESGLFTYDNNLKEWISSQESKTITSSIYPWTKTAKAGAVSCYPVGGTELKPVVDFMFTEVPPASGDKGPENPSTITGVSSINITRCGKNLMPINTAREAVDWGVERHGITVEKISDAVVSLTGKATQDTGANLLPRIHLPNGLTYTLSGADSDARINNVDNYWLVIWQHGSISTPYDRGNGSVFLKIRHDSYDMLPSIGIKKDWEFNNKILKIQIELGNQKTEFESPISNTYTIQLGNTYYGGTLDVASGVMTVTHEGFAYTGTENIKKDSTYGFYYDTTQHLKIKTSTSFTTTRFNSSGSNSMVSFSTASNSNFGWSTATSVTWATVDDLKSWLASLYASNAPLTVVYELAVPYTVQLSPTQILSLAQADKYTPRLNTVYTDAQAVQVGYVKSPIREEQELTQAIVGQGGEI